MRNRNCLPFFSFFQFMPKTRKLRNLLSINRQLGKKFTPSSAINAFGLNITKIDIIYKISTLDYILCLIIIDRIFGKTKFYAQFCFLQQIIEYSQNATRKFAICEF